MRAVELWDSAMERGREVRRETGERIHVEFEELVEIRMDGTERDRHQELMGREP